MHNASNLGQTKTFLKNISLRANFCMLSKHNLVIQCLELSFRESFTVQILTLLSCKYVL
jgi:hypothetical protein